MKMSIKFVTFMLLAAIVLMSCESNDTLSELRLSVDGYEVYTDGIEYSFEIISGAGEYKAEVVLVNEYDEFATVTVSENKVNVQLVDISTQIKVTDKLGQEKQFIIWSTNETLQVTNHSIGVGYGFAHKGKLDFGSGEFGKHLSTIPLIIASNFSSVVTIIISIFNKYNLMLIFELFLQKYIP